MSRQRNGEMPLYHRISLTIVRDDARSFAMEAERLSTGVSNLWDRAHLCSGILIPIVPETDFTQLGDPVNFDRNY